MVGVAYSRCRRNRPGRRGEASYTAQVILAGVGCSVLFPAAWGLAETCADVIGVTGGEIKCLFTTGSDCKDAVGTGSIHSGPRAGSVSVPTVAAPAARAWRPSAPAAAGSKPSKRHPTLAWRGTGQPALVPAALGLPWLRGFGRSGSDGDPSADEVSVIVHGNEPIGLFGQDEYYTRFIGTLRNHFGLDDAEVGRVVRATTRVRTVERRPTERTGVFIQDATGNVGLVVRDALALPSEVLVESPYFGGLWHSGAKAWVQDPAVANTRAIEGEVVHRQDGFAFVRLGDGLPPAGHQQDLAEVAYRPGQFGTDADFGVRAWSDLAIQGFSVKRRRHMRAVRPPIDLASPSMPFAIVDGQARPAFRLRQEIPENVFDPDFNSASDEEPPPRFGDGLMERRAVSARRALLARTLRTDGKFSPKGEPPTPQQVRAILHGAD